LHETSAVFQSGCENTITRKLPRILLPFVVEGRECLLGELVDNELRLNRYGEIVSECWNWLAHSYGTVKLDQSVIMPNHLHGIIFLEEGGSRTVLY